MLSELVVEELRLRFELKGIFFTLLIHEMF